MSQARQSFDTLHGALKAVTNALSRQPVTSMPEERELMEGCAELSKTLLERALDAELTYHLGYPKGEAIPAGQPNHRNGASLKTVYTDGGVLSLEIPRDRLGTFRPLLVPRHRRRFEGLVGCLLTLYARRYNLADLRGRLARLYPDDVPPDLLAEVTEAVADEMRAQRLLRLDQVYSLAYFVTLKIRPKDAAGDQGQDVYLALGVAAGGKRQVLGIWDGQTNKEQLRRDVLSELKNRGVHHILLAVSDGSLALSSSLMEQSPFINELLCNIHITRNVLPNSCARYLHAQH